MSMLNFSHYLYIERKAMSNRNTFQLSFLIEQRFSKLVSAISAGMYEREQILAIALLGLIAGHNTFLFGPPGTAKSLISRRLAYAFEKPQYFEYLMNRFSTPEEIFGPISISALKEDRLQRQIEGYLPTADFAFLDEIWKSSPAILNNLLTILNEGIFKNGQDIIKVPLKSLIVASNETPDNDDGLSALYDRFILRLCVPPIKYKKHFNQLLQNKPTSEKLQLSDELTIQYKELIDWRNEIHSVEISEETLKLIHLVRKKIQEQQEELDELYISDRRWQKIAILLKAAAFCCGRKKTSLDDLFLLKHCLWATETQRPIIEELIDNLISEASINQFSTELDHFQEFRQEIESLLFFDRTDKNLTKLIHRATDEKYRLDLEIKTLSGEIEKIFVIFDKNYFSSDTIFYPTVGYSLSYTRKMLGNSIKLAQRFKCYIEYSYQRGILKKNLMLKDQYNEFCDYQLTLFKSKSTLLSNIRNHRNILDLIRNTKDSIRGKNLQKNNEYRSVFLNNKEADILLSGIDIRNLNLEQEIRNYEQLELLCTTAKD